MGEEDFSFKKLFVPFTTAKAVQYLLLIGFLVFFMSVTNGFLGDDLGQVVNNPSIHSTGNILNFFVGNIYTSPSQSLIGSYYRPVVLAFYTIVYSIFGENAFAFHFFQIPIHIINSVLLFLFLKRIFKKPLAFVLSLVFLVHPINSEVSLYISALQDSLFFFFGMLALNVLSNLKTRKGLPIGIFFLLCSLFSKETGVLFVFASLLYLYLYDKKIFFPMLGYSLVGIFIFLVLRIHAIGLFVKLTSVPIANLPFIERMINIPSIIFFYLKTFFFPYNLAMIYQWTYKNLDLRHFYLPLLFDLSFFTLIFVLGICIYKKANKLFKTYLFFCIWFLAGMLAHLQIIPLDATVAERWFYFPIVGLLGLIGTALTVLDITKRIQKNKIAMHFVYFFLFTILFLLSARTIARGYDWKDEFTIATKDIKVSGDAYSLESELSYAYFQKKEYVNAKIHAQKSIAIYPAVINYYNLGAAEFNIGDYRGATTSFRNSLKYGDYNPSYENLGFISLAYGDHQQSINFLKKTALKKYPNDYKLWTYLAVLEYNYGDKNAALDYITKAVSFNKTSQQTVGIYNAITNNQPVTIDIGK